MTNEETNWTGSAGGAGSECCVYDTDKAVNSESLCRLLLMDVPVRDREEMLHWSLTMSDGAGAAVWGMFECEGMSAMSRFISNTDETNWQCGGCGQWLPSRYQFCPNCKEQQPEQRKRLRRIQDEHPRDKGNDKI